MLQNATIKAKVLIEALPYLKEFHHRFVIVKLGGAPIEDDKLLDSLLTDIIWLEQVGLRPILVHGGGTRITKALANSGIETTWHEGRRVTDAATLEIMKKEVELINMELVNRILELGGTAIGLTPPRHCVVAGDILDENIGFVGNPKTADDGRILRYASRGLIPVIPPLSITKDGQVMNTNADDIALIIAKSMHAEKLVFCSTIPGVCTDINDPETLIPSLTPEKVKTLLADGTITGGMIPKVESCLDAIENGVHKIHIIDAGLPHALLLEIFTEEGIGTEICKG